MYDQYKCLVSLIIKVVVDKEITTTALSPYYKLNTDAIVVKEGG